MKRYLAILFTLVLTCSFAQGKKFGTGLHGGRTSPKHPLFAALESDAFTPAERERLKALAAKDMRAFGIEMKKHYMKLRKAEASKILALRKQILESKDQAVRTKAEAELRVVLKKQANDRLKFHKRILDETERNIKMMQNRCERLRTEYEKRQKNKEQMLEKELQAILSDTPPKYLERHAAWDPDKPFPKPSRRQKRK